MREREKPGDVRDEQRPFKRARSERFFGHEPPVHRPRIIERARKLKRARRVLAREPGDRKRRAVKTLKKLGSTIVVGVGATKILGILGLAFASAALFRIYFFRMYLLMAVLGIFNSLFLLLV